MANTMKETTRFHLPLPEGVQASALLWQAAAAGAGVLAGAGQVYGGAAPFGLALVLGCQPGYILACAAGALAGGLLFQSMDLCVRLAGAVAAAVAGRRLWPGKFLPAASLGCGTLLAEELLSLVLAGGGATLSQTSAVLGTAVLAALLGFAMYRFPPEKPRSACLWGAVAAACCQRFASAVFAPGLLLAALAGLCAACAASLEQCATISLVLAAAVTAAAPSLSCGALACAMGSLAAALLFPGERLRCAGAFAAGCLLGALAAPDPAALLPLATGAGTALVIYLALPDSVLRQIFPPPADTRGAAATQGLSGAARRLNAVADTLSDIADTVNAVCDRQLPPRGESFDFVVEHTARRVCQGCSRRAKCWVRGYAGVVDGLYHLKTPLESRGEVRIEDLVPQLSECIQPAELCAAVNHGYHLWRSRRQTRARAGVLRAALTEQYAAMASALAGMADRLGQAGLPDPRRQARVTEFFTGLGLETLECTVTGDLAGRTTVGVTVARTRFTPQEQEALAAEVSRLCRRDFGLPDISHCRTVTMLTFTEKPLFHAVFGSAGRAAKGQDISGDALEQFCDSSGRAQLLLCDGMGTGRAAAVDGRMAARLTGELLRAGFAAESAARLVNVALGLKNADQESGSTLDLLTVDLYTGRAGLFKAGAAPSFVVRSGVPRVVEGASLPMGVVDSVVGRSTSFSLDAGDWVVLVSDGTLTDGTGWLLQQLELCARLGHTPDQAAEAIADAAAHRAGARQDDITVAVLELAAN